MMVSKHKLSHEKAIYFSNFSPSSLHKPSVWEYGFLEHIILMVFFNLLNVLRLYLKVDPQTWLQYVK